MKPDEIPLHTKVTITTTTTTYTGMTLKGEGETIILKLDNGYNVGINPKNITDIKIDHRQQNDQQPATETAPTIKENNNLPTITLLHTGGTIASKIDYNTGAVIAKFTPEELLDMFPELKTIANFKTRLVGNLQSEDFRFAHFNLIATTIHQLAQQGMTKFIITSGTDFLHYLSAALSFILKDLPIGVIVVGAQRSSDRGSSDAAINLTCAAHFLAQTNFQGVGVCMHQTINDDTCWILPGTATRKMHSSRRDAFQPINQPPIAIVNYTNKTITNYHEKTADNKQIPSKLPLLNEHLRIGMIWARPQFPPEELDHYDHYDGLLLVLSGLGHFSITAFDHHCKEHQLIKEKLAALAKRIPLVAATQTIYGKLDMDVYTPGRELQQLGIIGNGNAMTPETAYIKLAWLLSNRPTTLAEDYTTNIVGELTHQEMIKENNQ